MYSKALIKLLALTHELKFSFATEICMSHDVRCIIQCLHQIDMNILIYIYIYIYIYICEVNYEHNVGGGFRLEYEWHILAGMQNIVGRTSLHKGQFVISSQMEV
jgi:hypothetical protein